MDSLNSTIQIDLNGDNIIASGSLDDLPDVDEILAQAQQFSKIILEYLQVLSDKTGVPVETMMKFALAALFLLTLIGTLKDIASNMIGIIYPLFKSIECLE